MVREQQKADREFEDTCFYEELPLPVVGTVVSKDSATLEGYNAISIHANHRSMVKFGSPDDNGFKRLLGELSRWESQSRDAPTGQSTRSVETQIERPANHFNHSGSGDQFNSTGGTQNISKGSGSQFTGTTFTGSVQFS
ncbi:hypothetical protein TOPH_02750 [Tolypocladium ophioglossoides CBS 100239]|uniref:NACHT-NTPase sigma domain-containing protein n=1 Tax=Tolypocladium ophioglossoides (strain CBS 100239) TaxID=1163406 RepID=A0A0L0NEP0_TOLOC|nr:hypothetical protein TOPH_02750 [Tolypocladium ophioglossoides CBS 100239]